MGLAQGEMRQERLSGFYFQMSVPCRLLRDRRQMRCEDCLADCLADRQPDHSMQRRHWWNVPSLLLLQLAQGVVREQQVHVRCRLLRDWRQMRGHDWSTTTRIRCLATCWRHAWRDHHHHPWRWTRAT